MRAHELNESEKMDFYIWGNNTYIYKVMNIDNLEIFKYKDEVYIVVKSYYTTKKELYSNLSKTFDISKKT